MYYWGDALPSMPLEARRIHESKGAIFADSKYVVLPEDVLGYILGIVSYRGDGKYAQSTFPHDAELFEPLVWWLQRRRFSALHDGDGRPTERRTLVEAGRLNHSLIVGASAWSRSVGRIQRCR